MSKHTPAEVQAMIDRDIAKRRIEAAAPDLLEALKNLVRLSDAAAPGDGFDTSEACAAIAKAEGGSP